MNGSVKCFEKPSTNSECMHVKCKYIITIMWSNFVGFKFHFYHKNLQPPKVKTKAFNLFKSKKKNLQPF